MILEDGEKYACEHCIRGHRVSSCSHIDRPLQHINRKGRPLSQCQHCRGLRKSRAAHVKCECGDHAHSRNGSFDKAHAADDSGSNHRQCHCMSGKKCNCSIKKDPEDLHKSDTTTASHHRNLVKPPSIPGRRSESSVPRVRNSFHPPLHRNNHAAQESGIPYPHYRASTGFRPFHQAQRSVDSLPLLTYATTASQPQLLGQSYLPPGAVDQEQPSAGSPSAPISSGNSQIRPAKMDIPTIDLSAAFDVSSFKNTALSPGNPQRYSINDFSMLMNDGGLSWDLNNATPISGNPEPMGFGWSEWGFPCVTDPAEPNDSDSQNNNTASAQTIYQFSGGPAAADMRHSSQPNLSRYSPGGSSSDQGYGSSVPPSQISWNTGGTSTLPNMNMPWPVASSELKNELPSSVGYAPPTSSYQDSNAITSIYQIEELLPRSLDAQNMRDRDLVVENSSSTTDLLDSQAPPIKYESGPESVSGLSLPYLADDEVSNWTPNSEPDAAFATSPDFDATSNASPHNGYKGFDDGYSWLSSQQSSSQRSSRVIGS